MRKANDIHVFKATKHGICWGCRRPILPGETNATFAGVKACHRCIDWLKYTPMKAPRDMFKKKSNYIPVAHCRMCGKKTGSPDEHLCRDCIDTNKYVPIFAAHIYPRNENIRGIVTSIKDYEGRPEW